MNKSNEVSDEKLAGYYRGYRDALVPAVATLIAVSNPFETGENARQLAKFIREEPELASIRAYEGVDPLFAFGVGVDLGVVVGAQGAKKQLTELQESESSGDFICPQCKDAVVDLIAAGRDFVTLSEESGGVDPKRAIAIYDAFKAALGQLDADHDGGGDAIVGGA